MSASVERPEVGLWDLPAIERRVHELAGRLDAPANLLPIFDSSRDDEVPRISVTDRYHYVIRERGVERERRATGDIDELLYWIFESITAPMAYRTRGGRRPGGPDSRRRWFPKQLELLESLSPAWAARRGRTGANPGT